MSDTEAKDAAADTKKRGRGRQPAAAKAEASPKKRPAEEGDDAAAPKAKRGRGRPKGGASKKPKKTPSGKGRGRPKKGSS
jgi:hypothetical protein